MKALKVIKILIIVAIMYNAWLLLTTVHIQERFMRYLSVINYQADLFPSWIKLVSPTINDITGWILFLVASMQCSCIVSLLTTSAIPTMLTTAGLTIEGGLYIIMAETGREPCGVSNPGWGLVVVGLSLFAIREREIMIRQQYEPKK